MTNKRLRVPTTTEVENTVVGTLTLALVNEAADALSRLRQRTGLSTVDLGNRALIVYDFIEAELRGGGSLVVRDAAGSEVSVEIYEVHETSGSSTRCGTCDSHSPRLHPATSHEGEVLAICPDQFHTT